MVVDATVEHGGCVLANAGVDHGFATGVILDEVGNVVDNTSNSDEAAAVLGLLDIFVPFHDWELLERNTPVEFGTALVDLLLQLLDTSLFDLVGAELFQVVCQTELLPSPDHPFGWVILMPFDRVTIIGGELVVEVVVTFTHRDQSSEDVVTRRVAVIEGLISQIMGQGVHAEGRLLNEEDSKDTSIDETTPPVSPAKSTDQSWENQTHEDDDLEVVLVLPDDDRVFVEISDVGAANSLGVLLHDHPPKVGIQKTFADGIRILIGVGIAVMSTVVPSPPSDGTFNSTSANCSKIDSQRERGRVRAMSPETMVS